MRDGGQLWFGAIPIRLLSPRLVDIAHLTVQGAFHQVKARDNALVELGSLKIVRKSSSLPRRLA